MVAAWTLHYNMDYAYGLLDYLLYGHILLGVVTPDILHEWTTEKVVRPYSGTRRDRKKESSTEYPRNSLCPVREDN